MSGSDRYALQKENLGWLIELSYKAMTRSKSQITIELAFLKSQQIKLFFDQEYGVKWGDTYIL